MYCPNCGEQIPENSRFCQKCGAKLQIDPSENAQKGQTDDLNAPAQNSTITSTVRHPHSFKKAASAVSLMLLAVILVVIILTQHKPDPTDILSDAGKQVLEQNPDDQRVKDYIEAYGLLDTMSRSSINSSKTEEAVERLSQIGHSSGWEELADKADLYKNNLSFDRYYGYDYNDDQILEIKKLFANYLLGDVYADEYEYDKPLDYDLNSLQETFESYGATKTEELTWDYKSIAFDNADSKFSIKIITDRKGNIKRVCPGGSLFWDKEYYANFDDDADDAAKKAAEYLYEGIHDKGLTDVFTHESGGAINFLLTDIEKAQIISSLRALSQEDIEKMFEEATDLSFWYYLQLEDKTVMLDFVPGSVSIGDIQANEFYNATLFPDIVFYDETSSGTSTKYDDLNDFVSFPGDMLFGEVASPLSEDEAKDILFGDYPDTTVSVASNDAEAQDYEEINPEEISCEVIHRRLGKAL